jgi:hypothetical protein
MMTKAEKITVKIAQEFKCFGKGARPTDGNPIAAGV